MKLNNLELSIVKYYREGKEIFGFEKDSLCKSLYDKGFLNGELKLTFKGREFIKYYNDWDKVISFNNEMILSTNNYCYELA